MSLCAEMHVARRLWRADRLMSKYWFQMATLISEMRSGPRVLIVCPSALSSCCRPVMQMRTWGTSQPTVGHGVPGTDACLVPLHRDGDHELS